MSFLIKVHSLYEYFALKINTCFKFLTLLLPFLMFDFDKEGVKKKIKTFECAESKIRKIYKNKLTKPKIKNKI